MKLIYKIEQKNCTPNNILQNNLKISYEKRTVEQDLKSRIEVRLSHSVHFSMSLIQPP